MKTYIMKTLINKTLLATALTAALGVASTSAAAVVFPDFTVDATAYGAPATFVADKITGNYAEWVSINETGGFDVSILWNAGQFVANDGATALNAGGPSGTGLGNTYGMYALFQGSGTVNIGPLTQFLLTPGGSLNLYLDPNLDTAFVDPVVVQGQNPWTTANDIDDLLIASGAAYYGSGTLNTLCSGGINCGSYGQTTSFNLTIPDGTSFFTLPVPFYNLSFQSGQFNNFTPTGTQLINGSMDAVFGVPEPESLALLGIGLLGLAMSRRGRKQACPGMNTCATCVPRVACQNYTI
jgi:hypothetical protein